MNRGYEERYLLTLLSAVVNQKIPTPPLRALDWGSFFRLADYHKVAHIIHYGLLGLDTDVPQQVRQRFFDKYLESVFRSGRLKAGEQRLIKRLEEKGIRCAVLNDFRIVGCYPVEEMSSRDSIEILISEKSMDKVKRLMKDMDFEEESASGVKGRIYYSIPGLRVKFYDSVPYFFSKLVRRHYKHFFSDIPFKNGCDYVREMSLEEMYLYMLCRLTEAYALGDINLSQIVEIWLFYQKYVDQLAWDYIDERIEKLKIVQFEERMEQLMMRWAGAETPSAELEIYDAMEAYILTKGEEGRDVSSRLLPLIKTVADCYARNRRKENFRKKIQWMFPEREYMEAIYPVLEHAGILLPICWCLRLLRYSLRPVRVSLGNTVSGILRPVKNLKSKLRRKPQPSGGQSADLSDDLLAEGPEVQQKENESLSDEYADNYNFAESGDSRKKGRIRKRLVITGGLEQGVGQEPQQQDMEEDFLEFELDVDSEPENSNKDSEIP